MLFRRFRPVLCVSLALVFLSACGNTGALYLPGQEGDPNVQPEQQDPPSDSSSNEEV